MTDQQTIVRCKDCKHWEEHADYTGFGLCPKLNSKVDAVDEDEMALLVETYETVRDFGCVMGEKK